MSRVAGGMSITMGMIDYVGNFAGMGYLGGVDSWTFAMALTFVLLD